ncbi:MAG TPA: hypothetical protein VF370_00405 [Candidatus Cryosericum sp.]
MSRIISELELDQWVRNHPTPAESVIPELLLRLVRQSCPGAVERRIPIGDSVNQPGLDGVLVADQGFGAFVPTGKSCWEIGIGADAAEKATDDYAKRTTGLNTSVPEDIRKESTFIFVSPLSAQRSWRRESQSVWLARHRSRNEWADVRIVDGTGIVDWLEDFPDVELWLAGRMGIHVEQIELASQHWKKVSSVGSHRLAPELYLAGREAVSSALEKSFAHEQKQLEIDTHFPGEAVDFVSAFIASKEVRGGQPGLDQCLIVSGREAFDEIAGLETTRVLVLDFPFGDDNTMTSAIAQVESKGNVVVYEGVPGGQEDSERVLLAKPRRHAIEENLVKAGYSEERARLLAQQSDQNLSALLRLIQGVPAAPEWSRSGEAADLALAQLAGGWHEDLPADKAAVEELSGRDYATWATRLSGIIAQRRSPIVRKGKVWQFAARYEGWQCLGQLVHDEDLDRFRRVSIDVLSERDPQFDLPPDKRFAASMYGKTLTHSVQLRKGLSETLALLGGYPNTLTSCSAGSAEGTATLVVRGVLSGAGWDRWASLNDVLPLLAEAAPLEFLDAVDKSLRMSPCPFDTVLAQEGKDLLTGGNYMTGLLWALEGLAWSRDYFSRVVSILGELAQRDPSGNSANRPANSLVAILLPWQPQTTAALQQRTAAVAILCKSQPGVAWSLLVTMLPSMHQVSWPSHRPVWQTGWIPEDWRKGVTTPEYWDAVSAYADMTMGMARDNLQRLMELLEHLNGLSPQALDELLVYLNSDSIKSLPESQRTCIWNRLMEFLSDTKRTNRAKGAVTPEVLNKIGGVAEEISPKSPIYRHQRLFTDRIRGLFDDQGSYAEQQKRLDEQQQAAVSEVYKAHGYDGLLRFVDAVQSPSRVGSALGAIADAAVDARILPSLIDSDDTTIGQFLGSFVWRRYFILGWQWVDALDTACWTSDQKAQFLAYLPFASGTWRRIPVWMKEDEAKYWVKTPAEPREDDENLAGAAERLLEFGRPLAAVRCLEHIALQNKPIDSQQIIRTLRQAVTSSERPYQDDGYAISKLIDAVQRDSTVKRSDVAAVEWTFLPLLDGYLDGAHHKALDRELAESPAFFCQVIRMVFGSAKEKGQQRDLGEQQMKMAENGYRLLSEWEIPPGLHEDGTFHGGDMVSWLNHIEEECMESGHLEVALDIAGQVLFHVPSDPDGLWIDESAARVLDENDESAERLRSGFGSAIVNSRGAHWVDPSGQEERALADGYRQKADALNIHGYSRLAATFQGIAKRYDQEAGEVVARRESEE